MIVCVDMSKDELTSDTNFFDQGGHSLLATRLVSEASALFKIDLPISAIFTSPTVAEFTKYPLPFLSSVLVSHLAFSLARWKLF